MGDSIHEPSGFFDLRLSSNCIRNKGLFERNSRETTRHTQIGRIFVDNLMNRVFATYRYSANSFGNAYVSFSKSSSVMDCNSSKEQTAEANGSAQTA